MRHSQVTCFHVPLFSEWTALKPKMLNTLEFRNVGAGWHLAAEKDPGQVLADIFSVSDERDLFTLVLGMADADLRAIVRTFATKQFEYNPLPVPAQHFGWISHVESSVIAFTTKLQSDVKQTAVAATTDFKAIRLTVTYLPGYQPTKDQAFLMQCTIRARISAIPTTEDKQYGLSRLTAFEPHIWIAWAKLEHVRDAEDLYTRWLAMLRSGFPSFRASTSAIFRTMEHIKFLMSIFFLIHKEQFVTLDEPLWTAYLATLRHHLLQMLHFIDKNFRKGDPPAESKWQSISTVPFPRWMRDIWEECNRFPQADHRHGGGGRGNGDKDRRGGNRKRQRTDGAKGDDATKAATKDEKDRSSSVSTTPS